jgi:hypothetical protein
VRATFFKGVFLGAAVASVTLVASAAFAGTGIGSVFNLGRTNAVNGSTVLQGSTNGQQLRVVNSNTGTAAAGVGIVTNPARPPLAVNSATKVTNLNADLVDGLHASSFQRTVTGKCAAGSVISAVNANGTVVCAPSGNVRMEQSDVACATNGGDEVFCGTPFTETFDAKTAAHVTATQDIASSDGSHLSINLEICYAPHGTTTLTAVASVDPDFTAPANSYFAQTVSGVISGLTPGSYDIGLCNAFGTSNVLYGLSSQTAIVAETP